MPLEQQLSSQPIAVLGAGQLVSHLYRHDGESGQSEYRFSVCRLTDSFRTTHGLRPRDLPDLVKLCQVLAFAIEDDGWLSPAMRTELRNLFDELDEITRRWSEAAHG